MESKSPQKKFDLRNFVHFRQTTAGTMLQTAPDERHSRLSLPFRLNLTISTLWTYNVVSIVSGTMRFIGRVQQPNPSDITPAR
jgi:hypothetical protein